MKTTIDIADPLLDEARLVAATEKATIRSLVEEGLRHVIETRRKGGRFRLRRVTFKGRGFKTGIGERDWAKVLEISYGLADK